MKHLPLLFGLILLSGCAAQPIDEAGSPHNPGPSGAEHGSDHSPRIVPLESSDTCGKGALQGLVGQLRTQIPVPVDPARRRVVCTSCAMTMDYRADRMTILFDAETGIIKELRCG